jgi:hypothetical protein
LRSASRKTWRRRTTVPGVDDRIREELARLARPGDPDGAFEQIGSKKSRRRIVRRVEVVGLAVAVVAGSAGGAYGLYRVFAAGSPSAVTAQPSVTPSPIPPATPSGTPSESAIETPSESPSGPSAMPPNIGFPCGGSEVVADFDGDWLLDRAIVAPTGAKFYDPPVPCPSSLPPPPPSSITVAWGNGAQGTWPLSECDSACAAYAASDVDSNGTAEFAIEVDEGASTQFLEFLELVSSEAGPVVFEVIPPGTDAHPGNQPLKAATGGSVTHQDFVTCQTAEGGSPQLITTAAELSQDQTTWNLAETVFDFDGSAEIHDGQPRTALAFAVASTRDYTEPADPSGGPPEVVGDPCFVPS